MDNLFTVARQVAALFVLMGFGAFLRRARLVGDAAVEGFVNLLILVVTPCVIVDAFQRPFDTAAFASLSRMIPRERYSSSAPGISVMSRDSGPVSGLPLCPGMWSREVPEAI